MSSQAKEHYLKALYYLHNSGQPISITALGKEMSLSKPTVNDMVKKLKEKGWLVYEKYKPLKLTAEGIKEACLVIRKHRLAEMFLFQVMGFGWEEVHEMAEEIEHMKSEMFFDRMDEILGFPDKDPHGSPIPSRDGTMVSTHYKALNEIDNDSRVVLKAIRGSSSELLKFLNKKSLKLGEQLVVIEKEEFDQSVLISYGGDKEISLSQAVSKLLMVEYVTV